MKIVFILFFFQAADLKGPVKIEREARKQLLKPKPALFLPDPTMSYLNHTNSSSEAIFLLDRSNDATVSSAAAKVFKIIPLALVMLTSIIGNAIVMHAVKADIRMQTATNMLVASQSLADFGTSIFVIPFALISVGHDGWILGNKFCVAHSFFNLFFTQTTILQLVIIAFDRYLVIVKPKMRAIKSSDAIKLAILAWGIGFLGAFPWLQLLTNHMRVEYFPGFYVCGQRYMKPLGGLAQFTLVVQVLLFAVLPLSLIFYSYYQIDKIIRRTNHSISPLSLTNAQKLAINVYAKSASTSKLVIGTSLIQVFPACVLMLLDGLQVGYIPYGLKTTLKWIMWCHCIVKPIIYASKSPAWGNIIRKYLSKFLFCPSMFRNESKINSFFIFSNRVTLYRFKKHKKVNTVTESKAIEQVKETATSEHNMEMSGAWFLTAKPAWYAKTEPVEFSAF